MTRWWILKVDLHVHPMRWDTSESKFLSYQSIFTGKTVNKDQLNYQSGPEYVQSTYSQPCGKATRAQRFFKPQCLSSNNTFASMTDHSHTVNSTVWPHPSHSHTRCWHMYTVSQERTSKIIFVITISNFHQIWQFWHNDGKLSKIIWDALTFHLT